MIPQLLIEISAILDLQHAIDNMNIKNILHLLLE